MGNELRDRIARVLRDEFFGSTGSDPTREPIGDGWLRKADAVLAVLPQHDQVGWQSGSGLFYTDDDRGRNPHVPVVPVFVVRDTTEGETP